MLIGIMSESHGRGEMVRAACKLFDRLGVEHLIHCGDVGGTTVLDELVGRPCTFVWGNMDHPDPALLAYVNSVGLSDPDTVPVALELCGKQILIFHGHEPGLLDRAAKMDADYVFHGHTHRCRDDRNGRVRIINSGALTRAHRLTVATLDLTTDELHFHEIPHAL